MQKRIAVFVCAVFLLLGLSGGALAQNAAQYKADFTGIPHDKCTVVIVGKKASTDGSVISTHTCDSGLSDWTWRVVPAADHKEGETRRIHHFNQWRTNPPDKGLNWDTIEENFNGLEIPEIPHTFGYLHGMFGYCNDNQVGIGESTIGNRPELTNRTPTPKFDITMLTLIAMERAKTARHAIQIMGEMAEKYGYGCVDGGEMLAVTDPNEAWIFEVMPVGPLWTPETGTPGAIWCAQRIPDDHVSVCPNESRIGEIDLKNKDFFMASSNVTSVAEEMGFWDKKSGEPFSWKKAYSPANYSAESSNGSRGRMWRFYDLVAPSKKYSSDKPNMDFPVSIKPDKKLSVGDVIALLRDKFDGTKFWSGRGYQGGPFGNPNRLHYGFKLDGKQYNLSRNISVNRAEYITVVQVRDWLPNPIGGLIWLGLGGQDTDCFMPFYEGITKIPRSFEIGDHWEFNRKSARWAFDYVDFHCMPVYSYAIKEVRKWQEKWEASAIKRTPEIDAKAAELYKTSPKEAIQYLTDYSNNNANLVVNAWWELGDRLLVEYNHMWFYNIEKRSREFLKYPDWWLRELVKYNKLKPAENGH